MAIRDEIKRGRQFYLTDATKKEKFKYFLDYYGFRTLIIALVLIFGIYLIVDIITKPEDVLNGTFYNLSAYGTTDVAEKLGQDFLKEQNLDASKYAVNFNGTLGIVKEDDYQNYTTNQVITTQISAGAMDYMVGTFDSLTSLAYGESFADLSTIMTKEQIEKYKPYFRYIDRAVVTERADTTKSLEEIAAIPIPDSTKPEEMLQPIPVLIDISHLEVAQELYKNDTSDLCYGIIVNGENLENALKFLDFIAK